MVCKLHHTMSGTYTQEKCGEDSTPLSNAPEARCGLRHSGRRSAGHIFSLLREKIWKKRALENEIALSRLKRHFVSAYHSPMARPARNALRAAVESGFPSARYTVRVVSFTPVEYLTYGKRKAVLFRRAALRIAHKRASTQDTTETNAEYFDYHAGLANTHLYRVLQIQK